MVARLCRLFMIAGQAPFSKRTHLSKQVQVCSKHDSRIQVAGWGNRSAMQQVVHEKPHGILSLQIRILID